MANPNRPSYQELESITAIAKQVADMMLEAVTLGKSFSVEAWCGSIDERCADGFTRLRLDGSKKIVIEVPADKPTAPNPYSGLARGK